MDLLTSTISVHVFSDASEHTYGSVMYHRTEDRNRQIQVAFLVAALTSAQLAMVLRRELTLEIHDVTYWSDSTTVLTWLQSDSCKYKVFVGTRVAEIHELTDCQARRYVVRE
ncbi:hypothetical protein AAFF_G00177150 [Aldrovandia affinis]|uniref:Uncharacterized protein n=1 Tax=Aldrovandia affinis TaxID=143900 RepID=A0AAD7RNK3_9TELE|nr:hypothetical protein AAFF_G00177150 [Aldrovandia affinis]